MAIGLQFQRVTDSLEGQSKWWGAPDLPLDMDYPCASDGEPLLFVCQIRLEDIAQYDTEGLLPHTGMLYFFADMAEYVAPLEGISGEEHNGLGEWSQSCYKVIYSPTCDNLEAFEVLDDDDEPAFLEGRRFSLVRLGIITIPSSSLVAHTTTRLQRSIQTIFACYRLTRATSGLFASMTAV